MNTLLIPDEDGIIRIKCRYYMNRNPNQDLCFSNFRCFKMYYLLPFKCSRGILSIDWIKYTLVQNKSFLEDIIEK